MRILDLNFAGPLDFGPGGSLTDQAGNPVAVSMGALDLSAVAAIVINVVGSFTVCASGCDITAHSDLVSQADSDVLFITENHTENLVITASNMVIQGSRYTLTGTVTLDVGANYNVINCLNISGAVTDNGTGNIVRREQCPQSTYIGTKALSPFFP